MPIGNPHLNGKLIQTIQIWIILKPANLLHGYIIVELTTTQLKQIIKEELANVIAEYRTVPQFPEGFPEDFQTKIHSLIDSGDEQNIEMARSLMIRSERRIMLITTSTIKKLAHPKSLVTELEI